MNTKAFILIPAVSFCVAAVAIAGQQVGPLAQIAGIETSESEASISYPSTIVELFTSQGCSSCPPSNKLVRDIAGTDELLALTYSVDYWDYLGWKDTLGRPEFSQRQRNYGKRQFQGQVYTPQIILNGDTHAAKFSPDKIKGHKLPKGLASFTIVQTVDGLAVSSNERAGTLFAIHYTPGSQSIPVERGENRGQTITLANVVTSIESVESWKQDGSFETVLALPAKGKAVALLIQDGVGGPIVAAANYIP